MSATQLTAFIVACLTAGGLAALATAAVWKLRPNIDHNAGPGLLALGLGLLACIVFSVGAGIASDDPNAPVGSTVHGCQPGTYDSGGYGDGPKCFPWPPGTGR